MTLKGVLGTLSKCAKAIIEYMQQVKCCNDELLLMNIAYDVDELTNSKFFIAMTKNTLLSPL